MTEALTALWTGVTAAVRREQAVLREALQGYDAWIAGKCKGATMKDALSPVMQRALEAIRDAGGVAHPEQGGWWRGTPDGPRLEIESEDRRGSVTIQTNTIYALFRRGMLEPVEGTGNRTHRAFRLTPAAASKGS